MWLTIILIVAAIVGLLVVLRLFGGPGVRPTFNFNLIYTRALRIEGDKRIAIQAALEHLRTFLPPFVELTDEQIALVAALYSDVPDPKQALHPILTNAFKSKSLSPYFNRDCLKGFRAELRKRL